MPFAQEARRIERTGKAQREAGWARGERIILAQRESRDPGGCVRNVGHEVETERPAGLSQPGRTDRAGHGVVSAGLAGQIPGARDADVVDTRVEAGEEERIARENRDVRSRASRVARVFQSHRKGRRRRSKIAADPGGVELKPESPEVAGGERELVRVRR